MHHMKPNPHAHDMEEKEGSNDLEELSYCNGLSQTPLAVPMVTDGSQQSVTKSDAKVITQTRLKRLKLLSQKPEEQLSKGQKNEKKRIIRLEKNRRAAAMSRRKKKLYVKSLEEKYNLMARHLTILEMENAHLRALVNASRRNHMVPPPHSFRAPSNMPQNFASSQNSVISETAHSANPSINNPNVSSCAHSIEPEIETSGRTTKEPSLKRRRLNDGSGAHSTASPSYDNRSDISLEPLPISAVNNYNQTIAPPPAVPVNYVPVAMQPQNNMFAANMHPQPRMMPYAQPQPHHMRNVMHQVPMMQDSYENDNGFSEKRESESVEMENNNDIPPDIEPLDMANEYLTLLDNETVDEYGSINDVLYL